MTNFDNWMEDCINGGYGEELDRLEAELEPVDEIELDALEQQEEYDEYDGQPDEYTEWQDVYDGDDWDHGQYDDDYYDGGVDY